MEITQSIEIMKSLADTSRLQVLNSLMEKPQYVEELSHRLNLAVSTVSFHLKKLEKAGLVIKRKEQYYTMYSPRSDIFNLTLRELTSFNNMNKFAQEERIKKYRDKVIKTFFKRGKLLKLPVQRKKKLIVLDEFLQKFERGTKYSEKQVNDIITHAFGDYCTVRRLMIEENMMKRKGGIYEVVNKNEKGKLKMADKKELIKEYKRTLRPMGLYIVKNLENGKILIGSSKDLPGRLNRFKFELEFGTGANKELLADYKKLGPDKFTFEVLDKLEPKEDPEYDYTEDLQALEDLWLDKLKPFGEKGYNKIPKKK